MLTMKPFKSDMSRMLVLHFGRYMKRMEDNQHLQHEGD